MPNLDARGRLISDDGMYVWDGHQWVSSTPSSHSLSKKLLRVLSWTLAGIAGVVLLVTLAPIAAFMRSASRHDSWALGYLGVALILVSLAVVLGTTLGLRFASRRGVLTLGAIGAGILYAGTCGGGIALTLAHPIPNSSPSVIAERPLPSPTAVVHPSPTTTPSPSPVVLLSYPLNMQQPNWSIVDKDTVDILGVTTPGVSVVGTWGSSSTSNAKSDSTGQYDLRVAGLPRGKTVVALSVAADIDHLASETVRTTVTRTTSAAAIAGLMTRNSGVYNIPLPRDANCATTCTSDLGTIGEYTDFYRAYMPAHGWLYEPGYSWTDPAVGAGKKVGYMSNLTYCVPGTPIATVIITINNTTSQEQDTHVGMSITDSPNESSCP